MIETYSSNIQSTGLWYEENETTLPASQNDQPVIAQDGKHEDFSTTATNFVLATDFGGLSVLQANNVENRDTLGSCPNPSTSPVLQPEDLIGQVKAHGSDIYVIDTFDAEFKSVPINRSDRTGDVSHGELVAAVIESRTGQQVTRVQHDFNAGNVDGFARELQTIVAAKAAAQGVSVDKTNLTDVRVNYSIGFNEKLSNLEKSSFLKVVEEFNRLGGKIYIGAGNDSRSQLAGLPGLITVDGSEGIVGASIQDSRQSGIYTNGDNQTVANSFVVVEGLKSGGFDINNDNCADFSQNEITQNISPFEGKSFSNASVASIDNVYALQQKLFDAGDAAEQRQVYPEEDPAFNAISKELREYISGKVVSLGDYRAYMSRREEFDTLEKLKLPPDINEGSVYISAEHLTNGELPDVLLQVVEKQKAVFGISVPLETRTLQRIPEVGNSAPITGTSFAAPEKLSQDELNDVP